MIIVSTRSSDIVANCCQFNDNDIIISLRFCIVSIHRAASVALCSGGFNTISPYKQSNTRDMLEWLNDGLIPVSRFNNPTHVRCVRWLALIPCVQWMVYSWGPADQQQQRRFFPETLGECLQSGCMHAEWLHSGHSSCSNLIQNPELATL